MAISDIRYQRLGYTALTVTDPKRSHDFYRDIVGVATEMTDDGESVFLRVSDRHHDLMLTRGDTPALKRVGWEMESPKALAAVRTHLAELGIDIVSVSDEEAALLGIKDAFRVSEPTTGATFEFYIDMESAPRFEPSHTKIERLGHVVLCSPQKKETENFLINELNFRVSDRIGDVVTFLRCFPNPYHHTFGVGGGPAALFGHVNFMVTDIDDVGRANIRMKNNEVPVVFGPGHHPTSGSVFFYFLDPDGFTLEYSYGMEEFPEHDPREPRLFPKAPESFDTWGGEPDPAFLKMLPVETLA